MKYMSTISPSCAMLKRKRKPGRNLQSGFSIATAIFVIVILAALGAFMVTIGSGQQVGLAQDVTGMRVLQAARAGSEWGVHQALNTSGAFRTSCNGGIAAPVTISSLQGMDGISVKVECSSATYNEGASTLLSYQIVATACNSAACPNTVSPSSQYVERRISALVVN